MIVEAEESNPLVRARSIYNWMTENFLYSHAVEYSTLKDISEYCLDRRRGDCGQLALLYITLCRINGIPARWQSGWWIFPGGKTIHDWAEIYLQPVRMGTRRPQHGDGGVSLPHDADVG